MSDYQGSIAPGTARVIMPRGITVDFSSNVSLEASELPHLQADPSTIPNMYFLAPGDQYPRQRMICEGCWTRYLDQFTNCPHNCCGFCGQETGAEVEHPIRDPPSASCVNISEKGQVEDTMSAISHIDLSGYDVISHTAERSQRESTAHFPVEPTTQASVTSVAAAENAQESYTQEELSFFAELIAPIPNACASSITVPKEVHDFEAPTRGKKTGTNADASNIVNTVAALEQINHFETTTTGNTALQIANLSITDNKEPWEVAAQAAIALRIQNSTEKIPTSTSDTRAQWEIDAEAAIKSRLQNVSRSLQVQPPARTSEVAANNIQSPVAKAVPQSGLKNRDTRAPSSISKFYA